MNSPKGKYLVLLLLLFAGLSAIQAQKESIKLGLLLPGPGYSDHIEAVQNAMDQANAAGGYQGRNFELAVRTADGPWGAGSKAAVSLVYEDSVLMILGALDGRNAHLAEQVAARSQLIYIECKATDPTLTQAYVPWFFRMVPSDLQQADTLLQLITAQGSGKVTIVSKEDYDTHHACRSIIKRAASAYNITPVPLIMQQGERNIEKLMEKIIEKSPDHLIFACSIDAAPELIQELSRKLPKIQLYGTLAFNSGLDPAFSNEPGMSSVSSDMAISSYLFDAATIGIEAVRAVGPDQEKIRKHLLDLDFDQGRTGPVSFDEMGNRTGGKLTLDL